MTLTPLEQVLSLVSAVALALWGKPLLRVAYDAIFSRKATVATSGSSNVTTTASGTTVNVNTAAKTPSIAPDSPSPAQIDREMTRAAARAAGFKPGETAQFAKFNSIGPMRCDAHPLMVQNQETMLREQRESREEINGKLDTIIAAQSTAGKEQARQEARLDSAEKDIERHERRLEGR